MTMYEQSLSRLTSAGDIYDSGQQLICENGNSVRTECSPGCQFTDIPFTVCLFDPPVLPQSVHQSVHDLSSRVSMVAPPGVPQECPQCFPRVSPRVSMVLPPSVPRPLVPSAAAQRLPTKVPLLGVCCVLCPPVQVPLLGGWVSHCGAVSVIGSGMFSHF